MADGFDPCECMWSQDGAMQRLISLLRSSQSYCTDNECFIDGQNLPAGQAQENNGMTFLLICWLLLSFALYFLRPASRESSDNEKSGNNQDPGPPNPPSAIS